MMARKLHHNQWSLLQLALSSMIITALAFGSTASAQGVQCEQPNALIILDRSGSMSEDNKWDNAVNAIEQLTLAYDSAVRFGLSYFPTDGRCSTNNNVLQGVAPNNGANIRRSLDQIGDPRSQGATPLAGAIRRGTEYLMNLNDVNRKNVIVLITDGNQTCDGDGRPQNRAANALQAGFPVYVISFGRGATDTDTLNRMAAQGGTGNYYQADNSDQLLDSLLTIIQTATAEGCDGQDNDCDGKVDEKIPPQPCEVDCGRGQKICVDGQLSNCVGGDIPPDECDGEDNDCDGLTDETGYGECVTPSGNPGTAICLEGGVLDEICEPEDPNQEEVCDGIDNNMNGEVDENTDVRCQVDCNEGWRRCVEGILLNCSAPPLQEEVCNNFDDDCDGLIDEVEGICVGEETCRVGECLQPCINNECFGEFTCNIEENICERNPCPTPCADNQWCVEQVCITPCVADSQCPEGQLCDLSQRMCVSSDNYTPSTMVPSMGGDEVTGGMSGGGAMGAGTEVGAGFLSTPPPLTEQDPEMDTSSSCQAHQQSLPPIFIFLLCLSFWRLRKVSMSKRVYL